MKTARDWMKIKGSCEFKNDPYIEDLISKLSPENKEKAKFGPRISIMDEKDIDQIINCAKLEFKEIVLGILKNNIRPIIDTQLQREDYERMIDLDVIKEIEKL